MQHHSKKAIAAEPIRISAEVRDSFPIGMKSRKTATQEHTESRKLKGSCSFVTDREHGSLRIARHPAEQLKDGRKRCLPISAAAVPHSVGAFGVTHVNRGHAAVAVAADAVSGSWSRAASAAFIAAVAAPMSDTAVMRHDVRYSLRSGCVAAFRQSCLHMLRLRLLHNLLPARTTRASASAAKRTGKGRGAARQQAQPDDQETGSP